MKFRWKRFLKGVRGTVIISPEKPTVLIGERINPTGKKRLAAALSEGSSLDIVRTEVEAQVEARKIVERAEALGIPREDVVIDCLALTVGAEDSEAGRITLETIRMVRCALHQSLQKATQERPIKPIVADGGISGVALLRHR